MTCLKKDKSFWPWEALTDTVLGKPREKLIWRVELSAKVCSQIRQIRRCKGYHNSCIFIEQSSERVEHNHWLCTTRCEHCSIKENVEMITHFSGQKIHNRFLTSRMIDPLIIISNHFRYVFLEKWTQDPKVYDTEIFYDILLNDTYLSSK